MLLSFDDDGPGPVVVLLHGFPLDRSMWSHQQASVGSIYRVIAPDLRGHGTSAAPDGVYSVDEMADDVIELLDALQLHEPLTLGGLSMGGYVALSIAERYPDRIRALMLMNTRASADSEETARLREEMATEVDRTGDIEPVIAKMLPRLFSLSSFQEHPETVARLHGRMSRMTARAVAGTLRGLATRPDRMALLPNIKVPTLVIAGAEDQIVPAEETDRMAGALPNARLVTIAGAGHLAPIEKHEAVDAAILDFLQALW
ncbi:alpha/beta fold hydrolase [Tundrisphaera sp. TA3]|uniref:alpha/beta fold hydrolase n=1 Tax=Tundrisphaera sp. TA3 TaxID=3435775 RepID=UPI003EBF8B69